MNAYEQWNEALAARFFNPDMAGRNVHLYVNEDIIDEVEKKIPGAGTLRDAVAGRPNGTRQDRERICRRAFDEFHRWRERRLIFPPYIGYLSFFVLAGGTDGDFAPNAYYPRLRKLLIDEDRSGALPEFGRMRELWDDLEDWSVFDKQGEVGIFESRTIGGHVHIGYPLSQAILVEQDRRALPRVFYGERLDPASHHPADEIAMALRSTTARQFLTSRTVQRAENPSADLHKELIDAVAEELAAWDGTVTEEDQTPKGQAQTLAGLRVCIQIDLVAGIVNSYIRCKLNHEFPEDGLTIDGGLRADEDVNGWSLPVADDISGKPVDASRFDWQSGETMYSTSPSYLLRLRGYPIRVFTNGETEGISGFVDTPTVPMGESFYLCYPEAAWPRLERWATTQCRGFKVFDIASGLPESWRLARIEAAVDDNAVKSQFPMLSFQSGVRLRLMGGIRSGSGNNFLNFAPPSVSVTGGGPETEVFCDETLLSQANTEGAFDLPSNVRAGSRITIAAWSGQTRLRQVSLFLTGDFSLPVGEPGLFLDTTGIRPEIDSGKTSVAGAYVKGHGSEPVASTAELFEDLECEMGGVQGFLVGKHPGQVAAWPSEPFPREWTPTWAIKKQGRKLAAIFVGESLGIHETSSPTNAPTRQKVQVWKKLIWTWRKRFGPLGSPVERALWQQLQEVARDVR